MPLDAFGFPLLDAETIPPAAQRIVAAYERSPDSRWSARRDTLAVRGMRGLSPPSGRVTGEKIAFFSGGGSGSGKTEVTRQFIRRQPGIDPDAVVIIDPDEMKEVIPEYQKLRDLGYSGAASLVHAESKALSLRALELAMHWGRNIFYDSTLANAEPNLPLFERALRLDYQLVLVAATVHPSEALRRVLRRGERTGRYVPPASVLWTHKYFSRSFPSYLNTFDSCQLFDNNGPPESVRRICFGGRGRPLVIDNPVAIQDFYSYGELREDAATPNEVGL